MLPESSITVENISTQSATKAYELDFETKKIGGLIDGKDALIQAVKLALMTQRYKYPVFSHAFGIDYKNAMEEGYTKAVGKIKNAICDSLLCDSRISSVNSFEFEKMGNKIIIKFKLETIYGDVEYKTEVG